MPSTQTSGIAEGLSFEDFVKECALAASPFGHVKKVSFDTDEPTFVPSDYHKRCLEEAEEELSEISQLTVEEALQVVGEESDRLYREAAQSYERRKEEIRDLKKKYEVMLRKAKAWVPPTPQHEGLKEFMIRQLNESLENDCDFERLERNAPEQISPERALYNKLEDLRKKVAYHQERWDDEVRSCNERNQWFKDLRDSLSS